MEQVSVSKGLWRYGQVVVLLAVAGCGGGETSSSSNGTTSNVAGQGGNTVAGNAGSAGSGGSTSPSSGGTAGDSTSVVPGGNGGAAQGGTGGAAGAAAGSGGGGEGGSVGTAGAAGAAGASAAICPGGAYADSPLPEAGAVASIVCSDFTFSEGPVWLGAEGKLLFSDFGFQDAANDFPGNVMQYAPGGDCSVFASDVGSNGLAVALDGNVLGARNPTQAIASIDVATQMVTDIVTDYMGQSFSSPNDLTVRSDGTIYFTDPAWQLGDRTQELDHAVYRVDPEGNVNLAQALADRRPNGVTLSPDETKLYVSVIEPDQILVFDVAGDGSLSNQQTFVDAGSDGMAIDCAGNLYATSGVVHVYSPEGDEIGSITLEGSAGGLPDPTNLAFGGANRSTLYVTGASYLRSVELQIPGYPF